MRPFSAATARIEPHVAMDVFDRVQELRSDGHDIVDLSAGDPDFDTPPHIVAAAKDALDRGETQYASPKGLPALRDAIAEKFQRENGIETTPERVRVTPGGKFAVFESMFGLLREGDEVVVFDPSWNSHGAIAKLAGASVTHVPLDPGRGVRPGDVDLASVVSSDTRLLVVNTPKNPTGTVFTPDELATIRDLAVDHDFWVLCDEIYEKLVYDVEHHSLASFEGMADRTITVNGFSKAYAMTGWRLGYYTAPEDLLEEAGKVHSHSVTTVSTFGQHGALAALTGDQTPAEEMRMQYRERRNVIIEALANAGVDIPTPQGALYVFVPVEDDDIELCRRILEEEHVATVPGSAFGSESYIRLSYCTPVERIEEGISRVVDYL